MNKKGVEIAINQIVILIIGITIVGMGLILVGKIMTSGDSQIDAANANIRAQFERSLSSDELVDIPLKSRQLQSNELEIFHLGIYNDASVASGTYFTIIITGSIGADLTKLKNALQVVSATDTGVNSKLILETIQKGDVGVVPIGFKPKEGPLGIGQYTYNVCVCDGDSCLQKGDDTKQITDCTSANIQNIGNLYDFVTFSATVK
ncbi:hypothetical protein KY334_07540 [Candidatus Woesearchaeota archaeon]|nr:hypothetical protein [Candidatus Woesearchaeota archaeon]